MASLESKVRLFVENLWYHLRAFIAKKLNVHKRMYIQELEAILRAPRERDEIFYSAVLKELYKHDTIEEILDSVVSSFVRKIEVNFDSNFENFEAYFRQSFNCVERSR